MRVVLNEQGFVKEYASVGMFGGDSMVVDEPDNFEDFEVNFKSYYLLDGKLVKNEDRQAEIENGHMLNALRKQREKECFSYINRGELWYGRLSDDQKIELNAWYEAWLNVTETKVEPVAPEWIDRV